MMRVLTLVDYADWDRIVRSFMHYDVYWLSGYVKAFELNGDGKPLLLYCEVCGTRGINVVMKRDISTDTKFKGRIQNDMYFDLSSPYGYGGWIIEGEKAECIFAEYEAWCKDNDIVSEFVRFHPVIQNHRLCADFYEIVKLGKVVHIDTSAPDTIWNNLSSKNRNVIRKAIKHGVRIYNGRYPEIFKVFREIYNETMEKDNAQPYYYFEEDFYKSIAHDLPYNAQVFYAVKDGVIIAASIILMANGMMNYHLSGSLRAYGSSAATNLLLYEVAMWGCANGFKSLYLGGGLGSNEDSLFKFKQAFFRGELNHFYIGKKIFNQERYDELVLMCDANDNGYFPKYRG